MRRYALVVSLAIGGCVHPIETTEPEAVPPPTEAGIRIVRVRPLQASAEDRAASVLADDHAFWLCSCGVGNCKPVEVSLFSDAPGEAMPGAPRIIRR